jgi:hypothetical protein
MRSWLGAVCTLVVAACAKPVHATYEVRGTKLFENTIDGHECQELYLRDQSVAWVHSTVETSIGLVARICVEEEIPDWDSASPGTVYGGVRDGWHVIDIGTGVIKPLHLPSLSNYSNPAFCDGLAAYWAVRLAEPSSLILATLESGDIVREIPIGALELETDYMYHLNLPNWDAECQAVTFEHEGHIERTVIDAKSN